MWHHGIMYRDTNLTETTDPGLHGMNGTNGTNDILQYNGLMRQYNVTMPCDNETDTKSITEP